MTNKFCCEKALQTMSDEVNAAWRGITPCSEVMDGNRRFFAALVMTRTV